MDRETQQYIDHADYETLLRRWRFAKAGDPIFDGVSGGHFAREMKKKREALSPEEHTRISHRIGWGWCLDNA